MLEQYYPIDKCLICNSKLKNVQDIYLNCDKCDSYCIEYKINSQGNILIYQVRIDKDDRRIVYVYGDRVIFEMYQGKNLPQKRIDIKTFMFVDHLNFEEQLKRAEKLITYS